MKRTSWTFVSEHAQVLDYDGTKLTLGISTVGLANTFRRGQHAELVRQALIDVLGVDARVEGVPTPAAGPSAPGDSAQASLAAGSAPAEAASIGSGSSAPSPEAGDAGWASAPAPSESGPSWGSAAPSAAPSWASEPPPADDEVTPEFSQTGRGARGPDRGEPTSHGSVSQPPPSQGSSQSPLKRAQAAVAAEGAAAPPQQRVADDSAASDDDEDIADLGEVGRPVIERILGGTVIDETER
jgi:DNA polymerase-3 subunit gamma/tau